MGFIVSGATGKSHKNNRNMLLHLSSFTLRKTHTPTITQNVDLNAHQFFPGNTDINQLSSTCTFILNPAPFDCKIVPYGWTLQWVWKIPRTTNSGLKQQWDQPKKTDLRMKPIWQKYIFVSCHSLFRAIWLDVNKSRETFHHISLNRPFSVYFKGLAVYKCRVFRGSACSPSAAVKPARGISASSIQLKQGSRRELRQANGDKNREKDRAAEGWKGSENTGFIPIPLLISSVPRLA